MLVIALNGLLRVCGPNNDNDRKLLCDKLVGLMSWWEVPWCTGVILMFVILVKR